MVARWSARSKWAFERMAVAAPPDGTHPSAVRGGAIARLAHMPCRMRPSRRSRRTDAEKVVDRHGHAHGVGARERSVRRPPAASGVTICIDSDGTASVLSSSSYGHGYTSSVVLAAGMAQGAVGLAPRAEILIPSLSTPTCNSASSTLDHLRLPWREGGPLMHGSPARAHRTQSLPSGLMQRTFSDLQRVHAANGMPCATAPFDAAVSFRQWYAHSATAPRKTPARGSRRLCCLPAGWCRVWWQHN